MQIKGAAGESDFQTDLLKQAHDLQAEIFPCLQIFSPDGTGGEAVDQNIEGRGVEVGSIDQEEVLVDGRMLVQQLFDAGDRQAHLGRSCVVSDTQGKFYASFRHQNEIVDRHVHQAAVGDGDQGFGKGADAGRMKAFSQDLNAVFF